MITLSADNRSLLLGAPYTLLSDNTSAGVSSLTLVNVAEISADDFVLVGLFGNSYSEIFRVGAVDTSARTVTLKDNSGNTTTTKSAHGESTRVTVIPFNQVKFFWTAATGTISDESPTFNTNNPLSDWIDIDATAWFTTYNDASHSTGFGWFLFQDSVSLQASQNSNAIPYAGFGTSSVQFVFNDFMSLLNNRELKLVTTQDMFSWLNEANFLIRNKLNLSNAEYTVSDRKTISFVSGTSEYQLPDDFADLVQITDTTANTNAIEFMTIANAMQYTGANIRYYIRGRYIGFVPTPAIGDVVTAAYYRYRSKGSRLTGLDDYIDLPDNGTFVMKDWMMYRACLKFQNPNAQIYYKAFNDGLNQMIVSSIKRDANVDEFGIADWANT